MLLPMRLKRAAQLAGPDPILAEDHPNLSAMYTMELVTGNNLTDSSPNGNTGDIGTSISRSAVEAILGTYSMNFVGGSSVHVNTVRIADAASLNFGTGDFSVVFWVWPRLADSRHYGLIGKDTYPGSGSTYTGWFATLDKTADTVLFSTRDITGGSGNQNYFNSTGTVTREAWNMIALVRESGTLKISINNSTFETQAEAGTTDVTNASPAKLGWFDDDTSIGVGDGNGVLDGYEDQVRMFKGLAITQDNVATFYNAGAGA